MLLYVRYSKHVWCLQVSGGKTGKLIERMIVEETETRMCPVLTPFTSRSRNNSLSYDLCLFFVFAAGVHEYPFLYARVFTLVAKFASVVIKPISFSFESYTFCL